MADTTNMKYKDYLQEWIQTKKIIVGIHMQQLIESIVKNHINPKLGHMELTKIKPIHIQSLINQLAGKGYSSETIIKVRSVIRNSMEHACDLDLISVNSAVKVKLPRASKKVDIEVWNKDEVNHFLRAAKEDRNFVLFHLAIMAGMRQGELLGLRWKDVDLEKGLIRMSQTLSHDWKQFLEGAKTKSSIRTIQIPKPTTKLLKKQKVHISKEKLEMGQDYEDHDLVICTKLGTPLNPANVRRTFKRLLSQAEVKSIRFHDLRHTHATLLLSEGVNVKVISERLGHSNIKITLDTYSHILPTMQQEAVDKLNDLIL
ncbi:tyrosine-type recombinase/integrase [Bacillus sp. JJ1764]|uniref:tyrosine-type recombinase/integrase n=1 Tax=Bacillus sp. JJ1764 TaxID=3122964 RepID=UPI002FFD8789